MRICSSCCLLVLQKRIDLELQGWIDPFGNLAPEFLFLLPAEWGCRKRSWREDGLDIVDTELPC